MIVRLALAGACLLAAVLLFLYAWNGVALVIMLYGAWHVCLFFRAQRKKIGQESSGTVEQVEEEEK